MVGLIPKVLIDLVVAQRGDAAAAEVLARAGVAGRHYRLDTVYPDEEWQRLLAAACDVLSVTQDDAEVAFADQFMRDARERWPVWFEMSRNARAFLLRQQKIHNTFATGVRDPQARAGIRDKFDIEEREKVLVVHYRSPNGLCGLYRALARWVLAHYGETAVVEDHRCTKHGDPSCEIHVVWPDA